MNFEYLFEEHAQDSIDIEDMGNVCLNAFNDEGEEYYLTISTECGFSTIKQFGPLHVDLEEIPSGFFCSYFKLEYNDKKLYKTICDFLNNDKRNITQVFQIEPEAASERLSKVISKL